ncbi:MAG: DUF2513 domain-containing protein [Thermoguttaceae bacterium]|jgi:hypothetical protein
MKRNKELVKAILSDLEEHCNGPVVHQPTVETFKIEVTVAEFYDHCRLIVEERFARGGFSSSGPFFSSLTWRGHNLLDKLRGTEERPSPASKADGCSCPPPKAEKCSDTSLKNKKCSSSTPKNGEQQNAKPKKTNHGN